MCSCVPRKLVPHLETELVSSTDLDRFDSIHKYTSGGKHNTDFAKCDFLTNSCDSLFTYLSPHWKSSVGTV